MISVGIKKLESGQVLQLTFFEDRGVLSVATVIRYWQTNATFRKFFIKQLADAPFAAYFWEMPPLSRQTLQRPFECVLVESAGLIDIQADAECFSAYFDHDAAVVDFPNLGGDAWLLSPCPRDDVSHYAHLAIFSRRAAMCQQQALWQRLAGLITARLDDEPLWLSTSGLGVYWLHLRLDRRPKYYSYRPYRQVQRPAS